MSDRPNCACWLCWLEKEHAPHIEAQLVLNIFHDSFDNEYEAAADCFTRWTG